MADGKDPYYQDYSYQSSMFTNPYLSGSPPAPGQMSTYYQPVMPSRIQTHFTPKPSGMMAYVNQPSMLQTLGPHHQKQLEAAQKARSESTQHHHARIAAAQSRKNNNIQTAQNLANQAIEPRTSEASVGPRTPVLKETFADWTALDLSGMMISNLSRTIFAYEFLTHLYLNHNNLRFLSPDIAKLTHLVSLNLTGNKLTLLPVELGLVVSLKELLLFDNQIFNIPSEFGQLYQLEMLGLEGNPIVEPIATMIVKEGTQAVVQYLRDSCPMPQPPMDREWIVLEEESPNTNPADTLTVMSYNTLCEKYATPQTYAYTPSWALQWDYRKDLMIQEILNYNADVVCLQEVENGQYEDFFLPQLSQLSGYDGVFYPKSRARTMGEYERRQVDGCATFYKRSKFKVIDSSLLEFQQVVMQRQDIKKTEDMFNRLMVKDNIAVTVLLEQLDSGARLVVGNVHLHWDPEFSDVKVMQTYLLMQEIESLLVKWNRTHGLAEKNSDVAAIAAQVPIIIGGDLNSTPDSGVVDFLTSGQLDPQHPELKSCDYSPLIPKGIQHKLSLKSSHQSVANFDFTNFTPGFKGLIDYIWYSNNCQLTGLLSGVDREYCEKQVGFPNPHHPSDHIPLVVSLRRKIATNSRKVSFKK
ncbi:Endonuclease/exonuclease/phosphatase [Gorgonomyces haynaldii]|nr:Endonuclease/exonuclease/phosphatase [Gorgonomyces haynaldii]